MRLGGRVFEDIAAVLARRHADDLYHSVLEVCAPEGRFVIEMAPVVNEYGAQRGVVAEGPVGSRWAAAISILRYEVRCWRDGVTAYDDAVESPRRLTNDVERARRILSLVRHVPTPVWGRDDAHTGEMWSCNSLTSWLLSCAGLHPESIQPPAGGRAPGWNAGLVLARRSREASREKAPHTMPVHVRTAVTP